MLACGEINTCPCYCRPDLPTACIRNGHCASNVYTVNFEVECTTSLRRCNTEVDAVGACCLNVDGVLQPVTCCSPTDIVTSTCVCRYFDVYRFGSAVFTAFISWCRIIKGNVLTTRIIV